MLNETTKEYIECVALDESRIRRDGSSSVSNRPADDRPYIKNVAMRAMELIEL